MRSLGELSIRLAGYGLRSLYCDIGYIVWSMGTGDNIEFLFLEAAQKGSGQGRELYRKAIERIEAEGKPFHSVYTFTRSSNEKSMSFYEKLGFRKRYIDGLYKSQDAVLFWIPYHELKKNLGVS